MGLFSRLFGGSNDNQAQPKDETWKVDTTVPSDEEEGNGLTSRECRGCNNGNGEGICEYHANLFRRSLQRQDKIYSNRPRY